MNKDEFGSFKRELNFVFFEMINWTTITLIKSKKSICMKTGFHVLFSSASSKWTCLALAVVCFWFISKCDDISCICLNIMENVEKVILYISYFYCIKLLMASINLPKHYRNRIKYTIDKYSRWMKPLGPKDQVFISMVLINLFQYMNIWHPRVMNQHFPCGFDRFW